MLSESIMKDRAGNFTASGNHRLMAGWDKPEPLEPYLIDVLDIIKGFDSKPLVGQLSDVLGYKVSGAQINDAWNYIQFFKTPEGLITYAKEKACESLFDYDPSLDFSTVHTRNGDERELECVNILAEKTGHEFVNIGDNQAHIFSDEVGATPDGIVLNEMGLARTGCEVKCKSPLEHTKLLLLNDNADVLRETPEFYCQMQTQMLVTGTDHWYFAVFNPYAFEEYIRFKYIIIYRDDIYIKAMQKRLEVAKKIKAEYLVELKTETKLITYKKG